MVRSSARSMVLPLVFGAAGIASACAEARPAVDGPLEIRDAWARAADSGTTGGVYMTLINADTVALTLTAVSSTSATSAEIHETMEHDGMMHMAPRAALELPRDSSITMAPGGLHVMLNNLTHTLRAGDTIQLQLSLSDGRTVTAPAVIRAP